MNQPVVEPLTFSRASSISTLTSDDTMGRISLRRFSYRARRREVAVRSSAVLQRGFKSVQRAAQGTQVNEREQGEIFKTYFRFLQPLP